MKKVLMWSPNDLDGVSRYRQWGPMLRLEKEERVKLISMPGGEKDLNNWSIYEKVDLAFMQRPFRLADFLFIKECQKYNIPIWVDVDDDLFNIPKDNDAFVTFSSKEAREYMAVGLMSASIVSTATDHLREYLIKTFKLKNVVAIPNALDDNFLRLRNIEKHPELNQSISWRGSRSHCADLLGFKDEIRRTIRSNEKKNFLFWAYDPFFITDGLENTTFVRPLNFIDYITEFCKVRTKVLYVPLLYNHFNLVKSNIAWLESSLAGAVCLAPDFPEWRRPGLVNYNHEIPGDFERQLNEIIQFGQNKIKELNELSFEFIKNNLLLSQVNEKRMEIIGGL